MSSVIYLFSSAGLLPGFVFIKYFTHLVSIFSTDKTPEV